MKKIFFLLLICSALLVGCAQETLSLQQALKDWQSASETPEENTEPNEPDAQVILRLTHSSEKDSMPDKAAEMFRERLESLSGGQIQVEIYPENTLGKLDQALSFGNGRVDLRLGITGAPYSNIVMWLPLLSDEPLQTVENAYRADSAMRAMVEKNAEEQNIYILAVFPMQYRVLASTAPVESVADLSRLKMRIYGESGSNYLLWKNLCSQTVPVEIGNVPLALQMGVIDGCDNTLANLREYGIDQKITDITDLSMTAYFDSLYIDKSVFDRLPEEQRRQVQQAAAYTEQAMREVNEHYVQELREQMQEQGVRFHTMPQQEREAIQSKVQPEIYDFFCQTYGQSVIDEFIAQVKVQ